MRSSIFRFGGFHSAEETGDTACVGLRRFISLMSRNTKKTTIIFIYLILFFLLGFGIYGLFKPAPACFDGKRNQGEERTDCGGPCSPCAKIFEAQPIEVSEKAFVYGAPGKFDVFGKFYNPNNQFGSPNFSYEFMLKDSSGKELARKSGSEFILPAESKNIVATGLETDALPEELEIKINDVQWQEFSEYEKPQLGIYNKRYDLISSGAGYSEAYGLLKNESPFDFNFIKINVILRDSSGKPVAINSTDMRTVNANDQRDFRLVWPTSFPGDVTQVEMEAEADIYNSQNFIKKFLPGGKFQKYQ